VKRSEYVDGLAAEVRRSNPKYPPAMQHIADMGADALRQQMPDVGDDEIGAVLLCAAKLMKTMDEVAGGVVDAKGVINTLAILGERLYGSIPDEPWPS
jgi:hypothetical protein